MSFSCTIKAGDVELTGEDGPIHSQLLGLGPNGEIDECSGAPYRVSDFRNAVAKCQYGDRLKDAAIDCFKDLQAMARGNLEFLAPEPHCETCTCQLPEKKSIWWDADRLRQLLAVDPNTVTYVHGSW